MAEPAIGVRALNSSHAVGDNPHPTRVVIHATCPEVGYPHASAAGLALSTAHYFAGGSAGGSAHYVCDVAGEQHCVPDTTVAYHAPPNVNSLGIEICAEGGDYRQSYTREQWLADDVWPAVARAAARTRELCDRFGIPLVRLTSADLLAGRHGICGHVDVSKAWHQSTHSDPGPGFPWDRFMAAVTGDHEPAARPAPRRPPAQEDEMYIRYQPDKTKPQVITAILSGGVLVGLGDSEVVSAQAAIDKGLAVEQWVEKVTWDELDRRSKRLCRLRPDGTADDSPTAG